MAIAKKGTRNIEVNGIQFLYKVSKIKKKSDWRQQENELDKSFIKYAQHFGLGMVKDATVNIVVQLAHNPVSSIYVKCHTLVVDGFMGPEQIAFPWSLAVPSSGYAHYIQYFHRMPCVLGRAH